MRPTLFSATKGVYSKCVEVSWQAGTSIAWYELWRNNTADLKFATKLVDITGLFYNDTAVQPGIKYFYWLRPVTENGFVGSFTPASVGWRALAPPTSVSATKALYAERIRIDWNASEGAETYEVWRSTSPADDAVSQVFTRLVFTMKTAAFSRASPITTAYAAVRRMFPAPRAICNRVFLGVPAGCRPAKG